MREDNRAAKSNAGSDMWEHCKRSNRMLMLVQTRVLPRTSDNPETEIVEERLIKEGREKCISRLFIALSSCTSENITDVLCSNVCKRKMFF